MPGTVASIGANGAAAAVSTTVSTTNTVAQVPLTAVAHIVKRTAPLVITHQGQFPSATISFNLHEGASLGEAVPAIEAAEQEIGMPPGIAGSYAGDAAEFQRSLAAEPWLILAAVAVIYIVLGVLVREFYSSSDDHIHAAFRGYRRAAGADDYRRGSFHRGAGGHRTADGHCEEERYSRGGFRAGSGARTRGCRRRMLWWRPACCGSGRS